MDPVGNFAVRWVSTSAETGWDVMVRSFNPVDGGDGDMYIRLGALPSLTAWGFCPDVNGSNEAIAISNPLPGDFYIAIHGRSAYSSVGLIASYD